MSTFPGGTSVTRLAVYPYRCPADGLAGGTPHVHLASTEAYVVVGGAGELHTLDAGGFRVTPLEPGSTVWFTPGVIHRVVNHGDLRVVVVMSNAGLPEAGDAVMTFPPEVLADPESYRAAAALPRDGGESRLDGEPRGGGELDPAEEAVRRRRDLAVAGFRSLAESGDPAALRQFYDSAVALVRPAVAEWRAIWRETAEASARRTAEVLDALAAGDGGHLLGAEVLSSPQSPVDRWGMCGRLRTHDVRRPARDS